MHKIYIKCMAQDRGSMIIIRTLNIFTFANEETNIKSLVTCPPKCIQRVSGRVRI